jgi:hypothetical protein
MDNSDFKRTYVLRLKNGVEAKVTIPEHLYQERCMPFFDSPVAFEAAKKEIVMDAMGIEAETMIPQTQKERAAHSFLTVLEECRNDNKKDYEFVESHLRVVLLKAADNLASFTGGDGPSWGPPTYSELETAEKDAQQILNPCKLGEDT